MVVVSLSSAPPLRNGEKKEVCLGFRVSFNAVTVCVDKLFVSSFVLSLFIYYKRLRRRRRSDHLDFPNDEAIVFCVHGHVEHSFFVRVGEKTRDAFEGNVALTDAKADAAAAAAAGFLCRRCLQDVRKAAEHLTQDAEIGFGVVMDRRVGEYKFARFL